MAWAIWRDERSPTPCKRCRALRPPGYVGQPWRCHPEGRAVRCFRRGSSAQTCRTADLKPTPQPAEERLPYKEN